MNRRVIITIFALLLSTILGVSAVMARDSSSSVVRDLANAESLSEEITRVSLSLASAQRKANKSIRELVKMGEKISSRYFKTLSELERDAKEDWMLQEKRRLAAQLHAEWDVFFGQAAEHVRMAANGEGSPFLTGHIPLSGIEPADNPLKCAYFSYAMNPEFHDVRLIQSHFEQAVNDSRIALDIEAELMLLLKD